MKMQKKTQGNNLPQSLLSFLQSGPVSPCASPASSNNGHPQRLAEAACLTIVERTVPVTP